MRILLAIAIAIGLLPGQTLVIECILGASNHPAQSACDQCLPDVPHKGCCCWVATPDGHPAITIADLTPQLDSHALLSRPDSLPTDASPNFRACGNADPGFARDHAPLVRSNGLRAPPRFDV
jgi:hypothetical protein